MSVPYRAPPSLSNRADRWAGARLGLLLVAIASIVRAIAYLLEWEGLRTDVVFMSPSNTTLPRFGLTSVAMLTYVAVGSVASVGVIAFRRSLRSRASRSLALAAAVLLGFAAVAGVVVCLARTSGALVPGWQLTAVTAGVAAGTLTFIESAWRLEDAVRARTTGWTWTLAVALVVSIAAWQLWATDARVSLGAYALYMRTSPYAVLTSFAVIAATSAFVAIPCLRLRRRLLGALPKEPPALPVVVRTVQLHGACLEAKMALVIGIAALECVRRVPWGDLQHGWAAVFAVGDLVLDAMAAASMLRFVRDTSASRSLIGSILLRLPLFFLVVVGESTWGPALTVAVASNLFSVTGHHKFVRWVVGKLEPYCVGRTRNAYREATSAIIGALVVFIVVAYIGRNTELFIVVAGATAVVSVGLLRRHISAALAVIAEGEEAVAGGPKT